MKEIKMPQKVMKKKAADFNTKKGFMKMNPFLYTFSKV